VLHIHFETRSNKPGVFHITRALIAAAIARAGPMDLHLTLGEDLKQPGALASADGLVTSNDVLRDPRFPLLNLARFAPRLRWIHVIGAGIEPLLPLDWLPPGLTLTNNRGIHAPKAREFATMALLMLNSRMPAIHANQRAARWEPIFTLSIAGRTVAIIGVGEMGGAVANAAKRLNLRVIGIRRNVRPHDDHDVRPHDDRDARPHDDRDARPHDAVDEMRGTDRLHETLAEADFIVVATPLTPETRHLIDRSALAAAKRGAGLLNIGRAGVVDYAALCAALASGTISGAMLDVFDPEPLSPDSPLWSAPNVVITPHCSSDDLEHYLPLTLDLVFRNAASLQSGAELKNRVDPQRGY
jgi:phosphoglycerate dehydrogenase-like enzyme